MLELLDSYSRLPSHRLVASTQRLDPVAKVQCLSKLSPGPSVHNGIEETLQWCKHSLCRRDASWVTV